MMRYILKFLVFLWLLSQAQIDFANFSVFSAVNLSIMSAAYLDIKNQIDVFGSEPKALPFMQSP